MSAVACLGIHNKISSFERNMYEPNGIYIHVGQMQDNATFKRIEQT